MRYRAEIRGALNPFSVDAATGAVEVRASSKLEAALRERGYLIKDSRIEIEPSIFLRSNKIMKKGSASSPS